VSQADAAERLKRVREKVAEVVAEAEGLALRLDRAEAFIRSMGRCQDCFKPRIRRYDGGGGAEHLGCRAWK
jgi:hypothetical protein